MMRHTGYRRPLTLGVAVFGAGAMLAASSALAWPTIKNYLTPPAVVSDHAPQAPTPVAAVRSPATPAVSGFVSATREASAPTGPEQLVRASIESSPLVDIREVPRLQQDEVTAQEPDTGLPDHQSRPPVAETPHEQLRDEAPVVDSGDPDPLYMDPSPRPATAAATALKLDTMRGGPETLRSHRQLGTFR